MCVILHGCPWEQLKNYLKHNLLILIEIPWFVRYFARMPLGTIRMIHHLIPRHHSPVSCIDAHRILTGRTIWEEIDGDPYFPKILISFQFTCTLWRWDFFSILAGTILFGGHLWSPCSPEIAIWFLMSLCFLVLKGLIHLYNVHVLVEQYFLFEKASVIVLTHDIWMYIDK